MRPEWALIGSGEAKAGVWIREKECVFVSGEHDGGLQLVCTWNQALSYDVGKWTPMTTWGK